MCIAQPVVRNSRSSHTEFAARNRFCKRTAPSAALQVVRNHVAGLMLGFAPVREAFADRLSEVSIGYPDSSLTYRRAKSPGGPRPGGRAPVRSDEAPIGSEATPRCALCADSTADVDALLDEFRDLLSPARREPFQQGGIWRPTRRLRQRRGPFQRRVERSRVSENVAPQLRRRGCSCPSIGRYGHLMPASDFSSRRERSGTIETQKPARARPSALGWDTL